MDEKLETIFEHTVTGSDSDSAELQSIKEERMSTQKCLQICAQLSDHIDQIQLSIEQSDSSSERMDPDTLSERLTVNGLQECKTSLAITAAKLDRHMKDIVDRLVTKSKGATSSEEDLADLVRLRDQWDAARQCIDICSKADIHLKENVTAIENYGTGDAIQFMVSTDGQILHGKNRGLGWRTRQVGGHLSDETVQMISRDFSNIDIHNTNSEKPHPQGNPQSVSDDGTEHKPESEFRERYGQGFKLSPKATADVPMSSAGAAKGKLVSSEKGNSSGSVKR
jgi:Fungal N-terminal domain of STAND proteins